MNGGYEYVEEIGAEGAGRSVLHWLARRHRHSTEATWRARIEAGEVLIDGRAARASDVLRAGVLLRWRRPPWQEPTVPLGFAVLHLDDHLLAVAKPRGLPSVPNGGFLEHTLLHRVRRRFAGAVPMHRLGRGTSGIVLFARSGLARRRVAQAWRDGGVEKHYLALVSGRPAQHAFTVDVPIGPLPHPRLGTVHAASADGRPALSHVRVLEHREAATLVSVRIDTGRPHQIRIHLAAAGHPLVGDPLYVLGGLPGPLDALPGDVGYWLHAHRLSLTHPSTGAVLRLDCSPPPALRASYIKE